MCLRLNDNLFHPTSLCSFYYSDNFFTTALLEIRARPKFLFLFCLFHVKRHTKLFDLDARYMLNWHLKEFSFLLLCSAIEDFNCLAITSHQLIGVNSETIKCQWNAMKKVFSLLLSFNEMLSHKWADCRSNCMLKMIHCNPCWWSAIIGCELVYRWNKLEGSLSSNNSVNYTSKWASN